MICKNCKHVLSDGDDICQACGSPVIEHAVNEPIEHAVIKKSKSHKRE